ncbi:MAG: hypothetical protein R3C40_01810 [Parvularculaceae bacterium]
MAAYGPQEVTALDLERAPLVLSDRNIDGRATPSVLDAFCLSSAAFIGLARPRTFQRCCATPPATRGDRPVTVTAIYRPNGTRSFKQQFEEFSPEVFV